MFQPEIQTGIVILGDLPRFAGMTSEESKQVIRNGQENHDRAD